MNKINSERITSLENKVNNYFQDSYFDFQTMNPGKLSINETQIVRLVTKITVGLATVWLSSMELKSVLKTIKTARR